MSSEEFDGAPQVLVTRPEYYQAMDGWVPVSQYVFPADQYEIGMVIVRGKVHRRVFHVQ